MPVTAGTPRTRALAAALRQARERSRRGLRELARELGIAHATLSLWESGRRTPRVEDVAMVLAKLDVDAAERTRILDLARGAAERGWLAVGASGISQQLSGVVECERTASTITDWSPMLIPGLLQTGDYARAIFSSGGTPRSEVETKTTLRLGRREVLTRRNPAQLVALIGEAALHTRIGGPEVMADQLHHLLTMSALDTVAIHIVPLSTDWHPGLMGPFILFEFPDDVPPIVHLEHHRSGVFLYSKKDVAAYQEASTALRAVAMSQEDSIQYISEAIKRLETT